MGSNNITTEMLGERVAVCYFDAHTCTSKHDNHSASSFRGSIQSVKVRCGCICG